MTRSVIALVFCCSVAVATSAAAQDLFELEVFEYESTPPGGYELEFHTNVFAGSTSRWERDECSASARDTV